MSRITEIITSVAQNNFPGVYTVAEKVAYINQTNAFGESAVMLAACTGNCEGLQSLANNGANINRSDSLLNSPLHWSIITGNNNCANLLIDNGADLWAKNIGGETPLMLAAKQNNLEIAAKIIGKNEQCLTSTDNKGNTALHCCAINGNTDISNLLLDHGADINSQNFFGNTPLNYASKYQHTHLVALYLQRGADISTTNHRDENALIIASHQNNQEIVRLLLSNVGVQTGSSQHHAEHSMVLAKGDTKVAQVIEQALATIA